MYELIFIVVVFIYEWKNVRLPGIEPGLEAWEAPVIAAGPQPHFGTGYFIAVILG